MPIVKVTVQRERDFRLITGYMVTHDLVTVGDRMWDSKNEFGGGWVRCLRIHDVIPTRKEVENEN